MPAPPLGGGGVEAPRTAPHIEPWRSCVGRLRAPVGALRGGQRAGCGRQGHRNGTRPAPYRGLAAAHGPLARRQPPRGLGRLLGPAGYITL
eukprot:scaffold16571_cov122-Isochrysis_galbana.AAC.8